VAERQISASPARRTRRPAAAVLAGLTCALAVLSAAPTAAAADLGDPVQVALETDRIIDQMSVAPLDMSLARWTREILPWFAEQRIVREARAPVRVGYVDFESSLAIVLLATTRCREGVVSISARYANPVSSAYRSVDMLLTLAHELAHVQQNALCERAPSGLVETSAELMALEVAAAMALDGNRAAGLALLRELREIAVETLEFDAQRRGSDAKRALEAVRAAIYAPAEQARDEQRLRFWQRTPSVGRESLLAYAVAPYRKLVSAFRTDLVVTGLATPVTHSRPWASRPANGTLLVDDLAHFLDIAAELYGPTPSIPVPAS
jgi:hypothetical protein